jgi:hypothetical protein
VVFVRFPIAIYRLRNAWRLPIRTWNKTLNTGAERSRSAHCRSGARSHNPDSRLRLAAGAADLIQVYEARIAALERLVGKQALQLEFLRGASASAARTRNAPISGITGPAGSPSLKDAG